MSGQDLYLKRLRPVTVVLTAQYTRPADTNAYASGDVVANSTSAAVILTFANAARMNGGGGVIQNATLIDSSVQSVKPDFDLHLFDTAPSMQNDNVAWAPTDAEREKSLGLISFQGTSFFKASSNNGEVDSGPISKAFQCAAASSSLFGILVARNAYVPTNAEVFTVRLHIIQD